MRHLKLKKHLTAPQGQRNSIVKNLAKSLFRYKRITTTLGKAKAAKSFIERLITYAKKDGLHAYRLVESKIGDQKLVKRIVEDIAPNYKNRNGGYTRIVKAEPRRGDNAPMAILELVGDFELPKYAFKKIKERKKKDEDNKEVKKEDKPSEKKVVKKVKA